MALKRKTLFGHVSLKRVAIVGAVGSAAACLSLFYRTEPARILTLADNHYLNGSWLGWPVQFIYRTDIVSPHGNSVDYTVDGYLLGVNWLVWLLVAGAVLGIIVIQRQYADTRH